MAEPCSALDALRGARITTFRIWGAEEDHIPASALSYHPYLRRLEFEDRDMPPLRDLASYTELHGLRELVCVFTNVEPYSCPHRQLQYAASLTQLEVLDVDEMVTVGADATLAVLPRLRELNLHRSDLGTVPASMASLTRLTRLSLSCSKVVDGWQHLPLQLEVLDMSWLQVDLATMPPELFRLTCLTELDLSASLRADNAGLGAALPPALRRLDLSNNHLETVPAALAPLISLTYLDLRSNWLAGGIWRHLASMKQLAHLSASGCGLVVVPRVFSQLAALTSLDMSYNRNMYSWQHLGSMQQLAHLSAKDCGLAAVPPVFSQLTALTRLDLEKNPIVSDWQHLSLLALHCLLCDDRAHRFYRARPKAFYVELMNYEINDESFEDTDP